MQRRYSDFEWLRAELERESKVSPQGERHTKAPKYCATTNNIDRICSAFTQETKSSLFVCTSF